MVSKITGRFSLRHRYDNHVFTDNNYGACTTFSHTRADQHWRIRNPSPAKNVGPQTFQPGSPLAPHISGSSKDSPVANGMKWCLRAQLLGVSGYSSYAKSFDLLSFFHGRNLVFVVCYVILIGEVYGFSLFWWSSTSLSLTLCLREWFLGTFLLISGCKYGSAHDKTVSIHFWTSQNLCFSLPHRYLLSFGKPRSWFTCALARTNLVCSFQIMMVLRSEK